MTLIAGFFLDGCPILMGDLLVSDEDKADKEFVFPTAGKVSKRDILNGKGFGLEEARNSIETVYTIRNSTPVGCMGDYHPFCKTT